MKIAVDARTLGSRPSGVGMYLNDFLKVLMKYREFEFVLLSDVAESEYIRYFMDYTGESRIPQCGRVFLLFIYSETVK